MLRLSTRPQSTRSPRGHASCTLARSSGRACTQRLSVPDKGSICGSYSLLHPFFRLALDLLIVRIGPWTLGHKRHKEVWYNDLLWGRTRNLDHSMGSIPIYQVRQVGGGEANTLHGGRHVWQGKRLLLSLKDLNSGAESAINGWLALRKTLWGIRYGFFVQHLNGW